MIAFDALSKSASENGSVAATETLIAQCRAASDYQSLFYALLLKARVNLGVSPFPMGPAAELPEHVHEPYENAIREAAREVGQLYLAKNDLSRAWGYFRLINEPQPVKDALEKFAPGPDDDIYPVLDIAWHQRLHPERGYELLLDRLGICNAITTLGSTDLSNDVPLRLACIRKLITALHTQLKERLGDDSFAGDPLPEDTYHIDVSHLGSVVQFALELPPNDASLPLARELSVYGRRLNHSLKGRGDPPFEHTYDDYSIYLAILAEENVEAGIEHFEKKIAQELDEGNTFPAEVLVNLLVRLDRLHEALISAQKYLAIAADESALTCPGVMELARRAGDYAALAEAARAKGDAVSYLAARIAGRPSA